MANVFDQFDQPEQNVFDQFDAGDVPRETTGGDIVQSAMAGVNTLAPAILGIPMDTYTNAINLLRAGYGVGRKEIGEAMGEEGYIPPEPIGPQPGGSEWIKGRITELMGGDPFSPPDPTDSAQQNVHLASSIIGAGALSPTTGVKQTLGAMAKMAPSAGGAVAGKELFPEEPLAPLLGAVAAPAAISATQAAKAAIPKVDVNRAYIKAHKLGYKVPPALAKPTRKQQFIEGSAGPVPTKQKASIYNQKVTNDLIKKDLGYPKDVPLSREGLDAVRAQAGKTYEVTKNLGNFKVDPQFNKDIKSIANMGSKVSKEFPAMMKKDVAEMVQGFSGKKNISSEALVDVVKQLRADSSAGFRSPDPNTLAMAKAQGKMASALERLMERNVQTTNPDLVPTLKAARQRIAKTYEIEKALKGENVDAVALGRALDKGKPLSGTMRDVAEFGQAFKGAAQTNVPQSTNFRPMDLVAGVGGAVATQNPAWLAAMGARPLTRAAILSKPYQNMLARIPPEKLGAIKAMPKEAQAGALAVLLAEAQNQGD